MQRPGNRRASIRAIRPVIDTTSAVMDLRYKGALGNTGAWLSVESPQTGSGNCYFHKDSRIFRIKVRVPSSTTWTYGKGVNVDARITGWQ